MSMRVKCTSDDREMILKILQAETGQKPVYGGLPDFSVAVGEYTLLRSGWLECDAENPAALMTLAELALCEEPNSTSNQASDPASNQASDPVPMEQDFSYPLGERGVTMMLNLTAMVSARQNLLNRAIGARNAFYVAPKLMGDLLAHPPVSIEAFLQVLYGRGDEYRGIRFSRQQVALPGFRKGPREEVSVRRQLADRMVCAASEKLWTKPFTPRVRNQKYVFRVWLNALGMTGPDYEDARQTLLSRLPGRSDQRKIPVVRETQPLRKGGQR